MLATGLWMTHIVWTPVPGLPKTAFAVGRVDLMILIADIDVLRKQVAMAADGVTVISRRLSLLGRGLGAGLGLLVIAILYLMLSSHPSKGLGTLSLLSHIICNSPRLLLRR